MRLVTVTLPGLFSHFSINVLRPYILNSKRTVFLEATSALNHYYSVEAVVRAMWEHVDALHTWEGVDHRLWHEHRLECLWQVLHGLKAKQVSTLIFEPEHDKTNKIICAQSEDIDQPGHSLRLISLCCLHEEAFDPSLSLELTAKTD